MIDPASLFDGRRIHRDAYVSDAVFAQEMNHVFAATWVYLGHESQLPAPNTFVATWLGDRPVLLTRSRDGGLHGLLNRCRHRAVTLSTPPTGVAKSFRCEYHGWTYRNSGELSGVPFPKGYCGLDKSQLGLGKLTVDSFHGFVFGTLAADPLPLTEHLGAAMDPIVEWTARAPEGIVVGGGARKVRIDANWKVVWDNAADGYHPTFTHRSLLEVADRHREGLSLSHFDGDPDDLPMRTALLGRGGSFLDQRPSMPDGVWHHAKPVPGTEAVVASLTATYGEAETHRLLQLAPPGGMNVSVFPNLLLNGNFVTTLQPLSTGVSVLHESAVTMPGVPDEINWLRLRYCEDFVNFGEPDDIEMFERSQRGFTATETPWSDVSRGIDVIREGVPYDGPLVTVTDERPIREAWDEWARLMGTEPDLVLA
jgi:phenylpropionate dioxygenase-like ring-hydroxylating dioxygenase large terminal subunit